MPNEDEYAVVGGLVDDPARSAPVAWSWCQPEDFADERLRWLYEGIVSGWLAGMQEPGPRFHAIVAAHYADAWGITPEKAWGELETLRSRYGWCAARHVYEWYCQRLGAHGSYRRMAELVGRWYLRLRPPALVRPGGEIVAEDISQVAPRDARALLARLLHDLRQARRRAMVSPAIESGRRPRPDPW